MYKHTIMMKCYLKGHYFTSDFTLLWKESSYDKCMMCYFFQLFYMLRAHQLFGIETAPHPVVSVFQYFFEYSHEHAQLGDT